MAAFAASIDRRKLALHLCRRAKASPSLAAGAQILRVVETAPTRAPVSVRTTGKEAAVRWHLRTWPQAENRGGSRLDGTHYSDVRTRRSGIRSSRTQEKVSGYTAAL